MQGRYNDNPPELFKCGHARELGNIRIVTGYAACLICNRVYMREYQREYRKRKKPQPEGPPPRLNGNYGDDPPALFTCGHPREAANMSFNTKDAVSCKICTREKGRTKQKRRRAKRIEDFQASVREKPHLYPNGINRA